EPAEDGRVAESGASGLGRRRRGPASHEPGRVGAGRYGAACGPSRDEVTRAGAESRRDSARAVLTVPPGGPRGSKPIEVIALPAARAVAGSATGTQVAVAES